MKRLDLMVVNSFTVPGCASLRNLQGLDGPSVQHLLTEHGFVPGERVAVLLADDLERLCLRTPRDVPDGTASGLSEALLRSQCQ